MDGLRVVYTIWYRETRRFLRERGRIAGMVMQPLLYLLLVGNGIASAMTFRGAPAGAGVGYITFMYPGIIGMSVLFTSVFSAVSIIWDREFGFLREVLVAPAPRWAVALGKVLGIATVSTTQAAILLALAPLAHVPLTAGSVAALLLTCALIAVALGSLGIAVASWMETMEGFQMIMNFLVMPMFFLSGAMFPLRGVPGWLGALMRVNPLTYGVDALRGILLGSTPAAPLFVQFTLGLDLAVVAALALVLFLAGSWAFSRQA